MSIERNILDVSKPDEICRCLQLINFFFAQNQLKLMSLIFNHLSIHFCANLKKYLLSINFYTGI